MVVVNWLLAEKVEYVGSKNVESKLDKKIKSLWDQVSLKGLNSIAKID